MASARILILHNSPEESRYIQQNILAPQGYQVMIGTVETAETDLALAQPPDLVLVSLDWFNTVGLKGLTPFLPQNLPLPLIALVDSASARLPVALLRSGVRNFIARPFPAAEVLAAVEQALAESEAQREQEGLAEQLARTQQQLERYRREFNTLFGIGKSITAALDQQKLFGNLVEAAVYLTKAEEGTLLLLDERTRELYIVAARGIDIDLAGSLRLPVTDSLAGQVVASGEPLHLTGAELTKIKTAYLVRSLIYVPLSVKSRVLGVLGVSNRQQTQDFTNHDLRLLSMLADYAAVYLENNRQSRRLLQERTIFETIFNESKDPALVLEQDSDRVMIANAAFYQTFGRPETGMEGQLLAELPSLAPLARLVAAAPPADYYQAEIFGADHTAFLVTIMPIAHLGRALVLHNITQYKTISQIKTEFVAAVSHQLCGPLVSVKGYADMLQSTGSLNERQEMFVERIVTGLDKMSGLVNDLLDLSALEAEPEPELTRFDFSQLVAEIVAEFQSKAGRKQQQLIFHNSDRPAYIKGDAAQLKQVIEHLLENAIKYTAEHGQILVLVQVEARQVLLKVEDNGLGIPAEDLPFVFDKFFRVEHEDRSSIPGAGLGLAICRTVVDKHHGTIWAKSRHGQGSIFTVSLPFAAGEDAETAPAMPLSQQLLPSS